MHFHITTHCNKVLRYNCGRLAQFRAFYDTKSSRIQFLLHFINKIELSNNREKFWQDNGYTTTNILCDGDESSNESDNDEVYDSDEIENTTQISYVVGDVTQPLNAGNRDAIIIHCVGEYK